MVLASVLYIGVIRTQEEAFLSALQRKFDVAAVGSGKQAQVLLKAQQVDLAILDAVSLNTTGERICRALKSEFENLCIIHIHPGPKDTAISTADVLLFYPLTARRLVNSVGRLLQSDEEEVLRYGPFSMNVPRRILVAHGEEVQLTPKQAMLVELFLRSPGETIDRKTLMEKVWDTHYLGDTRTLDVHIRWSRKVIENGSTKEPRYLKTIRGVGYQLTLPGEG